MSDYMYDHKYDYDYVDDQALPAPKQYPLRPRTRSRTRKTTTSSSARDAAPIRRVTAALTQKPKVTTSERNGQGDGPKKTAKAKARPPWLLQPFYRLPLASSNPTLAWLLYGTLLIVALATVVSLLPELDYDIDIAPPATEPPKQHRGATPPTHYTFTTLPLVTEFIPIALQAGQLGGRLSALPALQPSWFPKAKLAIKDVEHSLHWLNRTLSWHRVPSSVYIAKGNKLSKTHKHVMGLCHDVYTDRQLQAAEQSATPLKHWKSRAHYAITDVHSELSRLSDEKGYWIHRPWMRPKNTPEQYSDFELVGEIDADVAARMNRSAAAFLSKFQTVFVPELRDLPSLGIPRKVKPAEHLRQLKKDLGGILACVEGLAETNWPAKAGLPQDEAAILAAAPVEGWISRALSPLTGGRKQKLRCGEVTYEPWMSQDEEFLASRWRCVIEARRALEAAVLKDLRKAVGEVGTSEALYATQIEKQCNILLRKARELAQGRGWEQVETTEIALTGFGHFVEARLAMQSSRGSLPSKPTDLRNVTLWRRMVLPVDYDTLSSLTDAKRALGV